MAGRLCKLISNDVIVSRGQQVRYGHHMRGKPPTIARNLEQRLAELNAKDPELTFQVDIGFAQKKPTRREVMSTFVSQVKSQRKDPEFERRARRNEIHLDLDEIYDEWTKTVGPRHIRSLAEHYNVFQDLFGDAYFHPVLPMDVEYGVSTDTTVKAYRGNLLKPKEVAEAPKISYEANPDSFWTLLLTTPDAVLTAENENNEYCHWFIGNIPGSAIEKGERLVDYMRPIPPRGIGFCRYVFVLYKQNGQIDYSAYKKEQPCLALRDRNWSTKVFYRQHQDRLTPAGLAFFQADWDDSLVDFYHGVLKMEEPIFEYDFPPKYYKKQKWFPLKQPFDLYLDRYKDPKDINKRYLLRKLKNVHPFREPEPPLKYPNAHPFPNSLPSWLKTQVVKDRMGWGRINEIK